MKRKLSLFLLAFVAMAAFAAQPSKKVMVEKSYTITFQETGTENDASNAITAIEDIIDEGAEYVSDISATKVYKARAGRGVKLGSSSAIGELKLTLAEVVKPSKIVVKARKYNDKGENYISINDNEFTLSDGDGEDCVINYDGETEVSEIDIKTTSGKPRTYVISVSVYYSEESGDDPVTVTINTMAVVGTFPGMSWEPTEGVAMTQDPDDPAIWSVTMEGVEVEGIKYEYKVAANGNWDDYVLPAGDNANFVFGTDAYPAGTYNLTFTADTENHTLNLVVDKQAEEQQFEILVLQGNADFTEGKALLIEATEEISANIWLTSVDAQTTNALRSIRKAPANAVIMEDGVAIIELENDQFASGPFAIVADKEFTVAAVTLLPNADASASQGTQVYPEPEQPLVINTLAIVGDFLGLEGEDDPNWKPENGWQMENDGDEYWYLTKTGVSLEAKTYAYKATANGVWGEYELPAEGNNEYVINEAGVYNLMFTANTDKHTLSLVAEKQADPVVWTDLLELDGDAAYADGKVFIIEAAEGTNANIRVKSGETELAGEMVDGIADVAISGTAFTEGKFTIAADQQIELTKVSIANDIDSDWTQIWPAEPQPLVISSMAIVGDFLGLEGDDQPNWKPENGWAMTQSTENPAIWTLTKEFEAAAQKYEYKAVANGNWDDYVLPAGDNANFVFGTEGYPAGKYDLTFTADTENHTLNLEAVPQVEPITPAFPDGTYYMVNASTGKLVDATVLDKEGAPLTFTFEENAGYNIAGSELLAGKQWVAEGDGYYTFYTVIDGVKKYAAVNAAENFTLITDGSAAGATWILLTQDHWENMVLSYNIAGTEDLCGVEWDVNANKMTKNAESGLYEWKAEGITVNNDVKPEFKVAVNNTEDSETVAWYPADGNWIITPDVVGGQGVFDITITFNNATKEIGVTATEAPAEPIERAFADGTYYLMNASTGKLAAANALDKEGAPLTFTFEENAGYTVVGSELFAGKQWVAEGDGYYTFYTVIDGVKKYAAVNAAEDFAMIDDGTAESAVWVLLTQEYWENEALSYNVAGTEDLCGEAWNVNANKMTKNAESGLFEWKAEGITVNNEVKPEFKVAVNNVADAENIETVAWYPADGNWIITPDVVGGQGVFDITITFNNATKEIGVTAEQVIEPVDPFENMTIDPEAGAEVASLKEFTLKFEGATSVNGFYSEQTDQPYLVNAEDESQVIFATYSPGFELDELLVILDEEVTADGSYKLVLPANTISVGDDYNQEALEFTYTVKGQKTFEVFLKNVPADFGRPYAYVWSGQDDAVQIISATWPGDKMSMWEDAGVSGYTWQVTAAEAPEFIIFNNGKNASEEGAIQTDNLAFENRKVYDLSELLGIEPTNPFENVKITPAEGEVTSLKEFELDFSDYSNIHVVWGEEYEPYILKEGVNERIQGTLGDVYDGIISITFSEEITAPGSYTLHIPAGAIEINEVANDPLSFDYTIMGESFYDMITIDPAEGQVESLESFTITFPAAVGEIAEGAVATLTNTTTGTAYTMQMTDAGKTVIVYGLDEPVTEAGAYTLDIPQGGIIFYNQGDDFVLDPLQFKYQVGELPEWTIDPAEGEVESLSAFTLTFNNYLIEVADGWKATLKNNTTGTEKKAYITEIGGGTKAYIEFDETVEGGEYTLTIPKEAIYKSADMQFITDVDLVFNYTIPVVDRNYYILGDFWGWEEAPQLMTQSEDNEKVYTLVTEVTVEAKKYEYKLRQGDNWNGYQLPASGNQDFVFGTDEYPAGDYILTFTADVENHKLTLDVEAKPEDLITNPVTPPAGLKTEDYTFSATFKNNSGSTPVERAIKIGFDGNDVYVNGLSYYLEDESWIKGKLNADKTAITFQSPQFYGTYSQYDMYFIANIYDYDAGIDEYPLTVSIPFDKESGEFNVPETLIIEEGAEPVNAWSCYGYYYGITITKGAPELPELVEVPEDLQAEEYSFTALSISINDDNEFEYEDYTGAVMVGFDGNDVYIQGISSLMPEAWIKGTLSDGKVVFETGQYMGKYYNTYDVYLSALNEEFSIIGELTFNIDANKTTLTLDDGLYLMTTQYKNSLQGYYYDFYTSVVIQQVVEKAVKPAQPEITGFEDKYSSWGCSKVDINIPTVDVNGDALVTSKLFYQIFLNNENTPLVFTTDVFTYLEEDMEIVPYGFTDGYDIFEDNLWIYDDTSTLFKIGIKSIYTGGGETNESDIFWYTLKDAVGIDTVNVDEEGAVYYDALGRRTNSNAKGLLIKQVRTADGVKTVKVARK